MQDAEEARQLAEYQACYQEELAQGRDVFEMDCLPPTTLP
jgi:hypothetical protein